MSFFLSMVVNSSGKRPCSYNDSYNLLPYRISDAEIRSSGAMQGSRKACRSVATATVLCRYADVIDEQKAMGVTDMIV